MITEKVETLDGWYCLHLVFQMNWAAWQKETNETKQAAINELSELVNEWQEIEDAQKGSHYLWNVTGHKGDFGFMLLRPELKELNAAENAWHSLAIYQYLQPVHSYVSVIELGTYSGMPKTETAWARTNKNLYPELPKEEYICFYPMNKVRSGDVNWYTLSYDQRRELMKEHGLIGRKYAGKIRQFITGSIGFDDHEWGVTLFAEDPLEFKKIIYEMRFSEASSVYSDFPYFMVGTSLNTTQQLQTYLGLL
ncbi:Fe-coproporphyrin III decarboxylase [Enterococcus sp. DIV2402]|uniref:Coproheme decarboxylase n=1 Tax=Candidatus Enterococcus lowellii TaxID=2230877 RepID=A0ABZ2SNW4_9ENTE|nr:hydrogen peroxide-dependent heme synthase [Enterococcus sp. DIV2402]MBO0465869.1 heme-dependent peroxidase [Enterococcus sp. DIV2402]